MVYNEPKNPLTNKGNRHVAASTLAVLGLSKSVIMEPFEEEETKPLKLPKLVWKQNRSASNDYLSWVAVVIEPAKLMFLIRMSKSISNKDKWEVYQEVQWMRDNETWHRTATIDFTSNEFSNSNIYSNFRSIDTKSEAMAIVDKLFTDTKLNSIRFVKNPDTFKELNNLLIKEFGIGVT